MFNDFTVTRQVRGCIGLDLLARFARSIGQVFAALRTGFSLSVFLSALLGPRLLGHESSQAQQQGQLSEVFPIAQH